MASNWLNISNRKQGGIRFIKLGRITISLSVTSKEAYEAKERKAARQAVFESMLIVERAAIDWERSLDDATRYGLLHAIADLELDGVITDRDTMSDASWL